LSGGELAARIFAGASVCINNSVEGGPPPDEIALGEHFLTFRVVRAITSSS
jgi:hypothetical protein